MSTTTENASFLADHDLRSDIEDELEWDPAVPSTNVGVSVSDHAVTLSGTVHTLARRVAAVKAARRVKGVHAIIDQIAVVPAGAHGTSDQEIGLALERVLEASSTVPSGITATVRDRMVTLTGAVPYQFQKTAAGKVARDIWGVSWVQNDIVVTPEVSEHVVRSKIVAAMHRNAEIDAKDVQVVTTEHEVWLGGRTRSHAARMQAELAAWSAPGVGAVHNNIIVTT